MTSPEHASDDNSLARSTGGAAARGALLIAMAVVIGLVLLGFALDSDTGEVDAGSTATETTETEETPEETGEDPAAETTGETGEETTTENTLIQDEEPEEIVQESPGVTVAPADVTVLVSNGKGESGVAGRVRDKITVRGYIGTVSNAPSTAESSIFYREGFVENAKDVATLIGATPEVLKPAPDAIAVAPDAIADGRVDDAQIIVIVGTDDRIPSS